MDFNYNFKNNITDTNVANEVPVAPAEPAQQVIASEAAQQVATPNAEGEKKNKYRTAKKIVFDEDPITIDDEEYDETASVVGMSTMATPVQPAQPAVNVAQTEQSGNITF